MIAPCELHCGDADIHSLLTYLSLFRHAELLKDGAPLCFPDRVSAKYLSLLQIVVLS